MFLGTFACSLQVGDPSLAYQLALFVSPSMGMKLWIGQSCSDGVFHVLTTIAPFEIAHMVVVFVAIDVVYFGQLIRIRYEDLCNQPVNSAILLFSVCKLYHYVPISTRLCGQGQESWALAVCSCTSMVTDFVSAVSVWDWSPNFLLCLLIHLCNAMSLRSNTFSFLFFPMSL